MTLEEQLDNLPWPPSTLTFIAERFGEIEETLLVEAFLLPLLSHKSPIVREGAIYGLSNGHLTQELVHLLIKISETDASEGVRKAALDAVVEWEQSR